MQNKQERNAIARLWEQYSAPLVIIHGITDNRKGEYNMKKYAAILAAALLLLALAACGAKAPAAEEKPGDTMSLEEIFTSIQKDVADLPDTANIELTDENFSSYLFIEPIDGAQALASDALINIVPHSAVLLRVPDGTDAEAVAEQIRENANPNKWICVGADKTVVSSHGQTILLVMSSADTATALSANFDALWA